MNKPSSSLTSASTLALLLASIPTFTFAQEAEVLPEQETTAQQHSEASAEEIAVEPPQLDPELHSYLLGFHGARLFQERFGLRNVQEGDLDQDALFAGFIDSMTGDLGRVEEYSDERVEAAVTAYDNLRYDRAQKLDRAFLEENAALEEVTVTESGLQYQVIEAGDGPALADNTDHFAIVRYQGSLVDGTIFDSNFSSHHGSPFPLNQDLIEGFNEALLLMQVGDNWKITIPANLAYGANPPTAMIPRDATLIFEVMIEDIEPMEPAQTIPTDTPNAEEFTSASEAVSAEVEATPTEVTSTEASTPTSAGE